MSHTRLADHEEIQHRYVVKKFIKRKYQLSADVDKHSTRTRNHFSHTYAIIRHRVAMGIQYRLNAVTNASLKTRQWVREIFR
jgi:hypothetical protein